MMNKVKQILTKRSDKNLKLDNLYDDFDHNQMDSLLTKNLSNRIDWNAEESDEEEREEMKKKNLGTNCSDCNRKHCFNNRYSRHKQSLIETKRLERIRNRFMEFKLKQMLVKGLERQLQTAMD
ncbi:coiled-coil domain-containing protein [Sarcoptes scabiei]|nr:coiled-coil domain-containing protein [Sarcoptes scabiei]